jgi:hypothetical protein
VETAFQANAFQNDAFQIVTAVEWVVIDDGQTPNWQALSISQTSGWGAVDSSQSPNWGVITP